MCISYRQKYFLCCNNTVIKLGKFKIAICYYLICSPYSNLINCHNNVICSNFILSWDRISHGSLLIMTLHSPLEDIPQSLFVFHKNVFVFHKTFWRRQVSCFIEFFQFGFVWWFLIVRFRYELLAGKQYECYCILGVS